MIYIGSDHAGFDLKAKLLTTYGNFADLGTYTSESCDYPIIAQKAGKIMKTFKEEGLSAVESEYHPIFEKYGFVLA